MEETSHSVWVNSKALERAGITKDNYENKDGAVYMINQATGDLSGILLENAGNAIMELVKETTQHMPYWIVS